MSKLKEAAQVALEALRPFAWDSGFEKQWKAFEILDHAIKHYTGMEDGPECPPCHNNCDQGRTCSATSGYAK